MGTKSLNEPPWWTLSHRCCHNLLLEELCPVGTALGFLGPLPGFPPNSLHVLYSTCWFCFELSCCNKLSHEFCKSSQSISEPVISWRPLTQDQIYTGPAVWQLPQLSLAPAPFSLTSISPNKSLAHLNLILVFASWMCQWILLIDYILLAPYNVSETTFSILPKKSPSTQSSK